MLETIIGTAAVISALLGRFIGYPAQIRLILLSRNVTNISLSFYAIGVCTCVLWLFYGFLRDDIPLMITQTVGVLSAGFVVLLILRFRPRRQANAQVAEAMLRLAGIDGHIDDSERREIDAFMRRWNISMPAVDALSDASNTSHKQAVSLMSAWLSSKPPVQQIGEVRDLVWLIVEADGVVTDAERALAQDLSVALESALDTPVDREFLVVCIAADSGATNVLAADPKFQPIPDSGNSAFVTRKALTEGVAREFAKELRSDKVIALAVRSDELTVAAIG